jgi:hypothetical protein
VRSIARLAGLGSAPIECAIAPWAEDNNTARGSARFIRSCNSEASGRWLLCIVPENIEIVCIGGPMNRSRAGRGGQHPGVGRLLWTQKNERELHNYYSNC